MEAFELALRPGDLTMGVAAREIDAPELGCDGSDLGTEAVAQAQAGCDTVKKQSGFGFVLS